jgi:hypothetical protein
MMKKPFEKIRKLFEKAPIVSYVLGSYVKALLISLAGFTAVFAILYFSGLYARIEGALDLKYNSPLVLAPMWGFLALSILCFFIGFLMYFYKYKRAKSKTAFHAALSNVLDKK